MRGSRPGKKACKSRATNVIVRGRTISILASRNVGEITTLGPLLAAKSVEWQSVEPKELFLEKVREDPANS